MSLFDNDEFRWRETYFVLFENENRPSLDKVQQVLQDLNSHFRFENSQADEDGKIESLTLLAPDDYAALDISFLSGEEIEEQVDNLAAELKDTLGGKSDRDKLQQLKGANARFDVMHFEQIGDVLDAEDEMLDPSALLVVLEALTRLTSGVCVDPQSGTLL